MIFEVFSSLKGSVICKDELRRLISLDGHPGKMGAHFKDFFGGPCPTASTHSLCIFTLLE